MEALNNLDVMQFEIKVSSDRSYILENRLVFVIEIGYIIFRQAVEAVIMIEHPFTLLNRSIRRLVFGDSNATNGKIGHLDCVDIPMNRQLWAGKLQMSKSQLFYFPLFLLLIIIPLPMKTS